MQNAHLKNSLGTDDRSLALVQCKVVTMLALRSSSLVPITRHFKLKTPNLLSSSLCFSCVSPPVEQPEPQPMWSGLETWRHTCINHNRLWGSSGPRPETNPDDDNDYDPQLNSVSSLAEMGCMVLSTSDPLTKSKLSHLAYCKWRANQLPIRGLHVSQPPLAPARPSRPLLVSHKEIPAPKNSGLPLNAYMLHNLAHVELNAIDLAWDTVVRFSPYSELLGDMFFADFARVADDESRHFAWCSQRLAELGFSYGDMPAHNLLWRECEKTSDDIAARLAVIPLVQEARGLDAGPRLVKKLIGFGDLRTSNIVAKIAEEEMAHVAVGVYWFVEVCRQMRRAPCPAFRDILKEYNVEVKGPFNYTAREEAGLPRDWYDPLKESNEDKEQLSKVYNRLAHIISMEKENSNLNREE